MDTNLFLEAPEVLADDISKYFESHPEVAEQFRRASTAYRIFGDYLNLTQARIIVREHGASTSAGVDLDASLLRANL